MSPINYAFELRVNQLQLQGRDDVSWVTGQEEWRGGSGASLLNTGLTLKRNNTGTKNTEQTAVVVVETFGRPVRRVSARKSGLTLAAGYLPGGSRETAAHWSQSAVILGPFPLRNKRKTSC